MNRPFSKGLFFFCIAGFVTACGTPPEETAEELFKKGEFYCLEKEWDNARDVLRKSLLLEPDHSGSHFYLARAYFLAEDFRPAIAEGEYLTALHFFERDGKVCRIDRFDSAYFEFITYLDLSKVCVYEFVALQSYGADPRNLAPTAKRARGYFDKAKAMGTVPADIEFMEPKIEQLERLSQIRTATRSESAIPL